MNDDNNQITAKSTPACSNPEEDTQCVICKQVVTQREHALFCDKCHKWNHQRCMKLSAEQYKHLSTSVEEWYCKNCEESPLQNKCEESTLQLEEGSMDMLITKFNATCFQDGECDADEKQQDEEISISTDIDSSDEEPLISNQEAAKLHAAETSHIDSSDEELLISNQEAAKLNAAETSHICQSPKIPLDVDLNTSILSTPSSLSSLRCRLSSLRNATPVKGMRSSDSGENNSNSAIDDYILNALAGFLVEFEDLKNYVHQSLQSITTLLSHNVQQGNGQPTQGKALDVTLHKTDNGPTQSGDNSVSNAQAKSANDWIHVQSKSGNNPRKQPLIKQSKPLMTSNRFKPLGFTNNSPSGINYDDDVISGIQKGIGDTIAMSNPSEWKGPQVDATKSKRRPPVVTQENPESNTVLSYRKTTPGNSLYSTIVDTGKKVGIFGDSMIKRILGKRISKDIIHGSCNVRPFLGATASELGHHIQPELNKCSYDTVVICGGTNNLPPIKLPSGNTCIQTDGEIAQEIINVGYKCRESGINNICISLLTVREGYEERILKINSLLVDFCRAAHFYFINHSNILPEHLYDGLHIDSKFMHIYANNISSFVNTI